MAFPADRGPNRRPDDRATTVSLASVLRTGVRAAAAAALLTGVSVAAATSFYASPTGTTSTALGTGTITNPWSLQTALSGPAAVHPGDTIWLRGGTYSGIFNSYLNGTSAAPIIVRQYPGERAKLDGGAANTRNAPDSLGLLHLVLGFRDHELLDRSRVVANRPLSY